MKLWLINLKALLLKSMGKNLEAIEDYKKLIKLDANDMEAYNNIGLVYFGISNITKACHYWKIASDAAYPDSRKYHTLYCK